MNILLGAVPCVPSASEYILDNFEHGHRIAMPCIAVFPASFEIANLLTNLDGHL